MGLLKFVGTAIAVVAVGTVRIGTGAIGIACEGARPLVGDKVCDVVNGVNEGIDRTVEGIVRKRD
jgi:hypothetical protein